MKNDTNKKLAYPAAQCSQRSTLCYNYYDSAKSAPPPPNSSQATWLIMAVQPSTKQQLSLGTVLSFIIRFLKFIIIDPASEAGFVKFFDSLPKVSVYIIYL